MAMKLATAAMVLCSVVILGIVFAQERKSAPALTTDDVIGSADRARVRPSDDGRVTGHGGPEYTGTVPREIAWEHDLHAALNNAEDGNRVVVVDVYTDWCGWCKKMDREIYSDPQVAALGREAVFLKLNAEDQGEGQRFAREAGVRGFPTTIVLDSRGRQLQQHVGYFAPSAAFVQWVHNTREQARNWSLQRALETQPFTFVALVACYKDVACYNAAGWNSRRQGLGWIARGSDSKRRLQWAGDSQSCCRWISRWMA
jgi:thiol-disulfide isomerase/thioredoxin